MKSYVLSLSVLLCGATSAAAQTEAAPLFITGGLFAGVERFSHSVTITPVSFSTDFSGTTTGGSLGVGTFVSPRWSVRLELTLPSTLETTFTPPTSLETGSLGPGVPAPVITQQVHMEHRTRTGAVLVAYHTPTRRRVSIEYLAGLAFVQERHDTVTEITVRFPILIPIPIQLPPSRTESVFVTYRGAATAGLDVNLAITSHFSAVPTVRAHVFAGSLSIRPGVGVRWTF